MHAAVERVIRSFSHKQPMQDATSRAMHDDGLPAQLAAQFLENYRGQLAERSRKADNPQQG